MEVGRCVEAFGGMRTPQNVAAVAQKLSLTLFVFHGRAGHGPTVWFCSHRPAALPKRHLFPCRPCGRIVDFWTALKRLRKSARTPADMDARGDDSQGEAIGYPLSSGEFGNIRLIAAHSRESRITPVLPDFEAIEVNQMC